MEGTQPKHLSYSSISTYLQCPAKWKFRYIDKVPAPSNANLVFGSAWHKTLEEYIAGERWGSARLEEIYHKRWDAQMEKEGDDVIWDKTSPEETKAQGESWIANELTIDIDGEKSTGTLAPFLDTIKPQKRQNAAEGENPFFIEEFVRLFVPGVPVPIIGYIDVITDDGIPTDFKTSGKSWNQKRAAEEMQPLFYLAALSQAKIRVPNRMFRHIVFVKGKNPKIQSITVGHNMAKLLWLYRIIEGVWEATDKGAFPVNPTGFLCSSKWCDYWMNCRGKFEGV
jgi:RecB family exonuclease